MMLADRRNYLVRGADWRKDEPGIAGVRRRVFIEEQGVPEAMEWEAWDADCIWFLAEAGDDVIGIVRLTPDGRLGRMAVLPPWRRLGVGAALLNVTLEAARSAGWPDVALHAQLDAMPFYRRAGFVEHGGTFMEAGIPHQTMRLRLR